MGRMATPYYPCHPRDLKMGSREMSLMLLKRLRGVKGVNMKNTIGALYAGNSLVQRCRIPNITHGSCAPCGPRDLTTSPAPTY